jgi:hypothetical protein
MHPDVPPYKYGSCTVEVRGRSSYPVPRSGSRTLDPASAVLYVLVNKQEIGSIPYIEGESEQADVKRRAEELVNELRPECKPSAK